MLEYLLLALAGLALWHLIVDGILSPDHQLMTRLNVAATGAALDEMRAKRGHELDLRAFHLVRGALENLVKHPSLYTLWTFEVAKHKIEEDPELQRQIAERSEILASITDPELREFRDKVPTMAGAMLTCNSAGWIVFVVPIAFALGMYRSTQRTIKAIMSLPEPQAAKFDKGPQTTVDRWFR